MTNFDNNLPNDSELHDRSAELAEEAVKNLKRLMVEGIPQRLQRIREEAFVVREAMWLICAAYANTVFSDDCSEEVRKHAFIATQLTATGEAFIHALEEAARPFVRNAIGQNLDMALDALWDEFGEQGFFKYLTEIYKDPDREEQVSRLNALINRDHEENQP